MLEAFGFSKEEQLPLTVSTADAEVLENPDTAALFSRIAEFGEAVFLLETNSEGLMRFLFRTGENRMEICTKHLEEIFTRLAELSLPKITFDAKPVYHAALERKIEMGELEDVKLQAYLLSNSDKTYSLGELISSYLPKPGFPGGTSGCCRSLGTVPNHGIYFGRTADGIFCTGKLNDPFARCWRPWNIWGFRWMKKGLLPLERP